jgi:hypothetical protein
MLFNEFIDKMLSLMSMPIPRLRNTQECLAIQLELQNNYVSNLVKYFIMLMPEYKYNWENLQHKGHSTSTYVNFKSIDKYMEYNAFHTYLLANNIFNLDEVEWLEDAIHEILVE